jgi:acetate---CoA ligase (ADP-forming) subunit beta
MDTKYLIKDAIRTARSGTGIPECEVKELLRKMGFPTPNGRFIRAGDAIPEGLGLAYPLVAKVSLESTGSKTELHGVRAGLQNEGELRSAVRDILEIEGAEGVLVEEMAPAGVEVIVGGIYDNQFGPVMMFGVGGIFTELFRDVSFGLAPLTEEDAHWMVSEIRGRRLLEGYRGSTPVDKESLVQILTGIAGIMATGLIEEIDLNPVALYPRGAMVLDAKLKFR